MQVTNVEVRIQKSGALLAYVNITFDDIIKINGWKIFKGRNEEPYGIQFPSEIDKKGRKTEDGDPKYWNTVWIELKNDAGRKLLEDIKERTFEAYEATIHIPKKNHTDDGETIETVDGIPF